MINETTFQQIKNYLINPSSIAEPGRFDYLIGTSNEKIWGEMGEQYPINQSFNVSLSDKAAVIWERLALEPSPKRFIEICRIIARHMKYVSYMPATESKARNLYASEVHGIFLWDIRQAFEHFGYGELIVSEPDKLTPMMIGDIQYIGEDLNAKESKYIIKNGYHSELLTGQTNRTGYNKKRWHISKLILKLKLLFVEAGLEMEKK